MDAFTLGRGKAMSPFDTEKSRGRLGEVYCRKPYGNGATSKRCRGLAWHAMAQDRVKKAQQSTVKTAQSITWLNAID